MLRRVRLLSLNFYYLLRGEFLFPITRDLMTYKAIWSILRAIVVEFLGTSTDYYMGSLFTLSL